MDYDYVIIGSGFGGAVSALRLAEKGYKVLVVEKGKWYQAEDFAKTNWDLRRWLWLPLLKCFGIMRISLFRHITVVSGVGVGGGSLVYANTLPVPKPAFFKSGSWSELNDWEEELKPHYQTALRMLGATENPVLFDGDKALQRVAQKLGKEDQFGAPRVAVYFGKPNETQPDPYFHGEGPERTGCNFCGACMTGCRHNAKNTLDKNYLHLAQARGASILAEHEVYDIQPIGREDGADGYLVYLQQSTRWLAQKRRIRTKGVIVSGGVLGTMKLLLKLKGSSLPRLSDRLGQDVRTNNETLVSVSSLKPDINVAKGVAIGSILHTDAHSHLEVVRYGEGSSAWKLLHLPYSASATPFVRWTKMVGSFLRAPWDYLKVYFKNDWARKTVVLLFMQSLDSTISFRRGLLGGMRSLLGKGKQPSPFIPESVELTKMYAEEVAGKPTSFVGETLLGIPSTAHILGGAVMGKDAQAGVIDRDNKVFGYQNMYVIDGSMISANPGVNPALSITAIAERAMTKIADKKAERPDQQSVTQD